MLFVLSRSSALFIFAGARASLRHAELTAKLPALSVAALARPALGVPANLPLSEAVRRAHEQKLRAHGRRRRQRPA